MQKLKFTLICPYLWESFYIMTHIPDSCYYLTIIVILSFSQVKMYVFVHMIIMTDIAKLQILIQQEEERGDDLEQKITHEMRLLGRSWTSEVDYHEADFRTETGWTEKGQHDERTEASWHLEMERKYIRGSSWIRGAICRKAKLFSFTSYLLMYFLTFTGVFIYSYIIFIYIYFLILFHLFFYVFDRKGWEHVLILEWLCTQQCKYWNCCSLCSYIIYISMSFHFYLILSLLCDQMFIVCTCRLHIISVMCVSWFWYFSTWIGESFSYHTFQ